MTFFPELTLTTIKKPQKQQQFDQFQEDGKIFRIEEELSYQDLMNDSIFFQHAPHVMNVTLFKKVIMLLLMSHYPLLFLIKLILLLFLLLPKAKTSLPSPLSWLL